MCERCVLQTTKEVNERFFKLIEAIESEIDPFDLNVLSPRMHDHLQKIVARSSVRLIHILERIPLVSFSLLALVRTLDHQ